MKRKRFVYFCLLIITIIIGLSSRNYPDFFSHFFVEYLGDTLWTVAVYLGICLIFPSIKVRNAFIISLVFSYLIEVSQLYHAPWIDLIRANRIAGLILGYGFLWSDLVCYTVGAFFAGLVDAVLFIPTHNNFRDY